MAPKKTKSRTKGKYTPKKNDSQKKFKTPTKLKNGEGYTIPELLPNGFILTDCFKNHWKIDRFVGYSGFRKIYLVTKPELISGSVDPTKYVLKLEPYTNNGPLAAEINFYKRVGKLDQIKSWMKRKKIIFLGIPQYIGSGTHESNKEKTHFLVMERFGIDVQKILDARKHLSKRTVLVIAIRLLDVLEYIHSKDFVHSDIKGTNVYLGYGKRKVNEIYLLDYGHSTKYRNDNKHKVYKEDPRNVYDGTIQYISIDAHNGVFPSRRSDLQILGYNLLHWLSGTLPWINNLGDKKYVREEKIKYKKDIAGMMVKCFPKGEHHPDIEKYFKIVMDLSYTEKPLYSDLRLIFENGLRELGPRGHNNLTSSDPNKKPKPIPNADFSSQDELSSDDEVDLPLKHEINPKSEEYIRQSYNLNNTKLEFSNVHSSTDTKRSRSSSPPKSPLLDISGGSKHTKISMDKSLGAIAKNPIAVKRRRKKRSCS